jgi:hypothetical protein
MNTFHHSYSQRILRYAPRCGDSHFYRTQKPDVQYFQNAMHATLRTKIEQFSSLNVIGPPQYSKPQLFKAPLPDYSGSNCGEEETCRALRGF